MYPAHFTLIRHKITDYGEKISVIRFHLFLSDFAESFKRVNGFAVNADFNMQMVAVARFNGNTAERTDFSPLVTLAPSGRVLPF